MSKKITILAIAMVILGSLATFLFPTQQKENNQSESQDGPTVDLDDVNLAPELGDPRE